MSICSPGGVRPRPGPFKNPPISPSCSSTSGKFAACVLQACGSDSTAETTCQPASRAPSQNPPAPQKSEIAVMVTRQLSRTCVRAFAQQCRPKRAYSPPPPDSLYNCTLAARPLRSVPTMALARGKPGSTTASLGAEPRPAFSCQCLSSNRLPAAAAKPRVALWQQPRRMIHFLG